MPQLPPVEELEVALRELANFHALGYPRRWQRWPGAASHQGSCLDITAHANVRLTTKKKKKYKIYFGTFWTYFGTFWQYSRGLIFYMFDHLPCHFFRVLSVTTGLNMALLIPMKNSESGPILQNNFILQTPHYQWVEFITRGTFSMYGFWSRVLLGFSVGFLRCLDAGLGFTPAPSADCMALSHRHFSGCNALPTHTDCTALCRPISHI